MKGNESVQEYLPRIFSHVSKMRSYGETITNETIVAKVLRSLPPKFVHVVAAIEESKDLSKFSFDELMGLLCQKDNPKKGYIKWKNMQAYIFIP